MFTLLQILTEHIDDPAVAALIIPQILDALRSAAATRADAETGAGQEFSARPLLKQRTQHRVTFTLGYMGPLGESLVDVMITSTFGSPSYYVVVVPAVNGAAELAPEQAAEVEAAVLAFYRERLESPVWTLAHLPLLAGSDMEWRLVRPSALLAM